MRRTKFRVLVSNGGFAQPPLSSPRPPKYGRLYVWGTLMPIGVVSERHLALAERIARMGERFYRSPITQQQWPQAA